MSTPVMLALQPLTCLREEEELFRHLVRNSAEETVAPLDGRSGAL